MLKNSLKNGDFMEEKHN